MGIMNKLNKMKNFLFDDEEEKVKKPEKKVIVKKEEKEEIEDLYFEDITSEEQEKTVDMVVQSRVENKEPKFDFPEFDDDDFMVTSKKPEPIIAPVKEEVVRPLYQGSKRKEEMKKFKPSPIISPIYGLLDSEGNVTKDDNKKDKYSKYNEEVTIDEVRKKAYGTFKSDVEDTLKRLSTKTIEEAESEMQKEELSRTSKNLDKVKEEKPIMVSYEEEDDDDDMILPNINLREINIEKEDSYSDSKVEDDDEDTKEQDLFNLIDTMYQNKGDED